MSAAIDGRQPGLGRAERGQQLLDVTLELIARHGYESASVAAIAAAAGVSKPIIYKIYPSRYALLLALYRREQKRIDAVLDRAVPRDPGDRTPLEVMTGALTGILEDAARHPDTWRLALFPSEGTPEALRAIVRRRRASLMKRARSLVEWGTPYVDLPEAPDADILAHVLLAWAEEHARILLEDESVTAEALIASATAILHAVAWRDPLPA